MIPFRSRQTLLLIVAAGWIVFCFGTTSGVVAGQEPAAVSSPPASANVTGPGSVPEVTGNEPGPTRQAIEEQIRKLQNPSEVQDSPPLDESTQNELLKRYRAALDWVTQQEEACKKTARYQAEIAGAPKLLLEVKSQLDIPVSKPILGFSTQTALQEMEQSLLKAESERKASEATLTQREEELKHRGDRKTELTKLIDDKRQQLESVKKQLVASKENGESAELVAARRVEFAAHRAVLEQQLECYQAEMQRHDAVADVLPLQRDLAQRDKNHKEKKAEAIRLAVAAKRKEASAQQVRQTRREVDDSLPALRELAKDNMTLANCHKKLTEQRTEVSKKVSDTEKTLSDLEASFEKIKERVQYAGNSSSIGVVLRSIRELLPDISKCEQQIRFVTQEMPQKNWDRLNRQEQRKTLSDPDAAVRESLAELDLPADDVLEPNYQDETRKLLEKKRDLLDQLIEEYVQYLFHLNVLEIVNNNLIAKVEEINNYVDERVLWVRSDEMLGPGTFAEVAKEVVHFCKPGPWIELSKQCGRGVIRKPGAILFMLTMLGIVFAVQRRLRARLRSLCEAASGSAKLKVWPTLEGLLLTVAMAAPLPLLLWLAGWWILQTGTAVDLGQPLGLGLRYTAILLWVLTFTRRLCAPGLLAESHFGWSPYGLGIARQHLRWFAYIGMPFIFVAIVTDYYQGTATNSVGRLAFIVIMLLFAIFMHLVLFSKNNVLREFMLRKSGSWPVRFRPVLYLLAIGLPLCFAIMAGIGYYYSAQQLALRLEATLTLVLGFVLLHAVVSRWFLVKRRNLAIDQMKERLTQTKERESESAPSASPIIPIAEAEQDWSKVHQRLQYLLYNAVAVGILVGGWMIWSDVLPALKVLDKKEFTFWYSTVEIVQTHDNANGDLVREAVPTVVPTTVRHALFAILILIATFVIGRHLPALLEITVLNQMQFDRGGRHAISVLLRYLVALIGIFLACHTMSITWHSVQWLAAGMTVGLGFGLQEIFANFISGLILLFERPIRVGDIITLGDTTGTVTNIRIRATTVTNWDRKELIVPNKELITGRLLNWTLSDAINRIVVTVGVAYKSDTRKVRSLILQIAAEHPNVLDHPAPHVTFESFGDSTLDFVLRCYIASMDARLDTIHELHEAVHDRFNQEAIEIAFPQRDLHVRSVEPPSLFTPPTKAAGS